MMIAHQHPLQPASDKVSVLMVGGPDVDARLDLMRCLGGAFEVGALGSLPGLRDKFAAQGFDYRAYHLSRRANPFADVFTVCQLASIFRKARPHIVHTFDTKPGLWGGLAARWAGVPVVIGTFTGLGSLYSNDDFKTRLMRRIYQPLRKWVCNISDLNIFQNRDDARQMIETGMVREQKAGIILGSGVQTDVFSRAHVSEARQAQLREEFGVRADEIVVSMISRVIRTKGVLEFMSAAQEINRRHSNVRFLLIGPDDEESLDRLDAAERARLKHSVIWPGARRDIPAVLAISDVFVLPSAYREGIPRVLLEAASMGLPIVTTDSPGCNEVVEDGVNGFLTPLRDAHALAGAITRLIEQPQLRRRFGQNSRQRAVERFDLAVIADQIGSMYRQLLARRTRSAIVESYG
jgi:glycosyltransferase involved in cell wall biosynthesis